MVDPARFTYPCLPCKGENGRIFRRFVSLFLVFLSEKLVAEGPVVTCPKSEPKQFPQACYDDQCAF